MAPTHSIRVDLPADLYQQVREAAMRSDQSIEPVLVDSLALLFGDSPGGWDQLGVALESLPDEQLWAVIYGRLTWTTGARLREVTARGKQAPLTEPEQAELEVLIDEVDRYTVLRSRALLLLKRRGYDIEARLKPGA